jgi:myo-inositol-1(or 4)-monophosphatase
MSAATSEEAHGPSEAEAMVSMLTIADAVRPMILAGIGSLAVTKGDGSPVTEVDGAINQFVIEQIMALHPEAGVLGEEGTKNAGGRAVFVVDPIDGTAAYSMGLGVACFSIAYVVDGVTRCAVLDDPFTSSRFSAVLGQGARMNDVVLTVGVASRSNIVLFEAMRTSGLAEVNLFSALRETGANPVRYLAYVGPSARVATGAMAGALFGRVTPWDYLGVSLIVREAGGVARDFNGDNVQGMNAAGGIILAHPTWYNRLRNTVDVSW